MTLDHPTLATEGCLWFPDLTTSCLSFEGAGQVLSAGDVYMTNQESDALRGTIAPMGIYGVIVPTPFYLLWRDNLSNTMKTISHFYMRTFAKSTFEAGILQGRSRAQQAISNNVVCFVSRCAVFVLDLHPIKPWWNAQSRQVMPALTHTVGPLIIVALEEL